jgi:hypothetical protein
VVNSAEGYALCRKAFDGNEIWIAMSQRGAAFAISRMHREKSVVSACASPFGDVDGVRIVR